MISLFLSTFIYSLVSMQLLAVGILSVPILVHLLCVRLKTLKYAASWFLIIFLEALQLQKLFASGTCPCIQETHYLKENTK